MPMNETKTSAILAPFLATGIFLITAVISGFGMLMHSDNPYLFTEKTLAFFVFMSATLLFIYFQRKLIYFIFFIEKTVKVDSDKISIAGEEYYFDDISGYKIIRNQHFDTKVVAVLKDARKIEVYKYSSQYTPFLEILESKHGKKDIIHDLY